MVDFLVFCLSTALLIACAVVLVKILIRVLGAIRNG